MISPHSASPGWSGSWNDKTPAPSALPLRSSCVGLRGVISRTASPLLCNLSTLLENWSIPSRLRPGFPQLKLDFLMKNCTASVWGRRGLASPLLGVASLTLGFVLPPPHLSLPSLLLILGPKKILLPKLSLPLNCNQESLRSDFCPSTTPSENFDLLILSVYFTNDPQAFLYSLLIDKSTTEIRSPIND